MAWLTDNIPCFSGMLQTGEQIEKDEGVKGASARGILYARDPGSKATNGQLQQIILQPRWQADKVCWSKHPDNGRYSVIIVDQLQSFRGLDI